MVYPTKKMNAIKAYKSYHQVHLTTFSSTPFPRSPNDCLGRSAWPLPASHENASPLPPADGRTLGTATVRKRRPPGVVVLSLWRMRAAGGGSVMKSRKVRKCIDDLGGMPNLEKHWNALALALKNLEPNSQPHEVLDYTSPGWACRKPLRYPTASILYPQKHICICLNTEHPEWRISSQSSTCSRSALYCHLGRSHRPFRPPRLVRKGDS